MTKTCLIIDDEPQDETIERIESKLRSKYVDVKCLQFNVGSIERQDLLTDGHIDLIKVLERFKVEFTSIRLDLICIDYRFDDPNVDGLELLKVIYPLRKSSTFMMFSSSLEKLVEKIIDGYDGDKNKKKLLTNIKLLTKYRIDEFVSRENYDDAIVALLTKSDKKIELLVEEKLLEYPDLIFQNTYPKFEGKTLQDIAVEIRKGTLHGNKYLEELIEQSIAYMVLINNV